MPAFIIAAIRTLVPMGVGAVVLWLATLGLNIDTDAQAQLVILGTFVLQALYYLVVKALEQKWPKVGVLLGVPKAPVYGATDPGITAGDGQD